MGEKREGGGDLVVGGREVVTETEETDAAGDADLVGQ